MDIAVTMLHEIGLQTWTHCKRLTSHTLNRDRREQCLKLEVCDLALFCHISLTIYNTILRTIKFHINMKSLTSWPVKAIIQLQFSVRESVCCETCLTQRDTIMLEISLPFSTLSWRTKDWFTIKMKQKCFCQLGKTSAASYLKFPSSSKETAESKV